ncbi:class I SAM-dependent methyltransferase [Thermus thermamylovorans]|uniref:Class I SAM-dependent methyltransferase n=1 Tax=Thermus thermamylovorans TaxID=2509362 RepID=A0A4Q9B6S4_9DEIN|nr:class I SAM-dependent methyltransferase [Thermus thermamylovorans]TBH20220.1 class I SAM-dependent methyltransferase [Thermus thermamylovorans]
MAVKALFALYPLLQGDFRAVEKALSALEASGVAYRVFPTHTELSGEEEGVFQALKAAYLAAAEEGGTVLWALLTNACETRDPFRQPERLARFPPLEIARKALEGLEARSALDLGTGTGVFAEAFARLGLFAVGVDPRADRLEVARARVPGARFLEGRAEELPFPEGSFDLAFFGLSLHHLDPLPALREAARVAWRVAVLEWPHREEGVGPPLERRFTPEALAALFQQALGSPPRLWQEAGYLLALWERGGGGTLGEDQELPQGL